MSQFKDEFLRSKEYVTILLFLIFGKMFSSTLIILRKDHPDAAVCDVGDGQFDSL